MTWRVFKCSEINYLRKIAGIFKLDNIRSENIKLFLKLSQITNYTENIQQKLFVHINILNIDRLLKNIYAKTDNKRRRGGPRKEWLEREKNIGRLR